MDGVYFLWAGYTRPDNYHVHPQKTVSINCSLDFAIPHVPLRKSKKDGLG
ncbi:MAG: hypothetical protein K9I84_08555 [Leadbetterella sp.]|nr:hypothetical protein [Leadbetterella sp.]